jgi:hypothetical protein
MGENQFAGSIATPHQAPTEFSQSMARQRRQWFDSPQGIEIHDRPYRSLAEGHPVAAKSAMQ